MKSATMISKILLGLTFVVFGSNGFLNFIPTGPLPTGLAGQFLTAFLQSHYVFAISGFEVAGGMLLLVNRYVPLGLTLLGPLIVNIILYHVLLDMTGFPVAAVVTILWGFLVFRYRQYFSSLFVQKAL